MKECPLVKAEILDSFIPPPVKIITNSQNYEKFLSVEEFTSRFGPKDEQLTIAHPSPNEAELDQFIGQLYDPNVSPLSHQILPLDIEDLFCNGCYIPLQ